MREVTERVNTNEGGIRNGVNWGNAQWLVKGSVICVDPRRRLWRQPVGYGCLGMVRSMSQGRLPDGVVVGIAVLSHKVKVSRPFGEVERYDMWGSKDVGAAY